MTPREVIAKWLADDVIAAIDAAGYVILPKEPTEAQLQKAWDELGIGNALSRDVYGAMREAFAGGEERPKP